MAISRKETVVPSLGSHDDAIAGQRASTPPSTDAAIKQDASRTSQPRVGGTDVSGRAFFARQERSRCAQMCAPGGRARRTSVPQHESSSPRHWRSQRGSIRVQTRIEFPIRPERSLDGRMGGSERIRRRGRGREEIPGTDLARPAEEWEGRNLSSVGDGKDDVSVSRGTNSRRGGQIASRGFWNRLAFRKTGHRPLRDTSKVRGGT